MQSDIRFYIDDRQVDLQDTPKLLYNWVLTDFSNPTIVKNSYTKTIQVDGTKNNNDIFGHFWDLDRVQQYGGNTGESFNPTYRVPFTIYIGGDIFEKGYVKLQKVKYDKGKYTYEIGLFGSLGLFLYNLQTDWNTGEKKTLADLTYYVENTPLVEPSSDFVIDKETVKDAWDNVDSYSSKWSVLNFAPCYNGKPEKMDAKKAVVNMNNIPFFQSATTVDGVTYRTSNGYVLAELPSDLVEAETDDFRSWMQRPVIRVKSIFDAITRKENNRGKFDDGYEVVLDPEWFNSRNPYVEDSWMTLPLISKLDIKTSGKTESAYTASYSHCYTDNKHHFEFVFDLSQPVEKFGSTAELTFDLMVNVPNAQLTSEYDTIYPSGVFWKGSGFSYDGQLKFTNVYAIQGFSTVDDVKDRAAMDGTDVFWLQYNRTDRQTTLPFTYQSARYFASVESQNTRYEGYTPRFATDACQVQEGYLVRYANKVYRWCNPISLSVPLPIGATSFRIRVDRVGTRNFNGTYGGDPRDWLFRDDYYNYRSSIISGSTFTANQMLGNRDYRIATGDLSSFYSGQHIKIKDLLNTPFTPADFLLDYCKMFGLYIHKDKDEDKIYIDTRNTYFKRDKIYDISQNIAYDKGVEITPTLCDSGYISLSDKYVEGECYKDYKETEGKVYGQKILATGWEFDTETKELVKSNFKGGVQTRFNSVYCFEPIGKLHPYMFDGVKYSLYANGAATGDTQEMSIPKKVISEFFPAFNNIPYYDLDDRVQFCDDGRKALDGAYVLLFRQGDTDVQNMGFWLTDDIDAMSRLCNKPCWLLTDTEYDTNGNRIAIELNSIPHFSRYWTSTTYVGSGSSYNNILFSMDYGSPRQLYLLNFVNYDNSTVYSQFFSKFYEDMYDVDTKAVTLWIKPDELLSADNLRRVYWFSNCLWRLNKIVDYSPIVNELVKCEFVKLQSIDALTNEMPSKELELVVTLDKYSLDGNGGTVVGSVHTSDYGPWHIESWDYDGEVTITPLSANTDGTFTVSVPSYYSSINRNIGIRVSAGDLSVEVIIVQSPISVPESVTLSANSPISSASTTLHYSVSAVPSAVVELRSGATVLATDSKTGTTTGVFNISANDTQSARTYTLYAETPSGASATTSVVQNAANPEPPTPSEDYTIQYGDISIDQDHSDITGYSLTGGTITILNNNSTLKMVGVNGDENGLSLEGNIPWTASTSALTNCTINVDFGNLQWNQFLNPDVKIIVTINGDTVINMQYSQDGLSNGIPNVDLTQYANNQSIRLDVGVIFRTAL